MNKMKSRNDEPAIQQKEYSQEEYNKKHGITPKTIKKDIRDSIKATLTQDIGVEYKLEKQEDVKETINKLIMEINKFTKNNSMKQILLIASLNLLSPVKTQKALIYQLESFRNQGKVYPERTKSKYINNTIRNYANA